MIRNKDHQAVNIVKNATVLRNPQGQLIGAIETLTDISKIVRYEEEILSLRKAYQIDEGYYGMLGHSAIMQQLFKTIENVAQTDAPVGIDEISLH